MIFKYIELLYKHSYDKPGNWLFHAFNHFCDKFEFKKVLKYISHEKSNYTLLSEMNLMIDLLIKAFGYDRLITKFNGIIEEYSSTQYEGSTIYNVKLKITDDPYEYSVRIQYALNTVYNANNVVGYYIIITNKQSRISNGYNLYSDDATRFPLLDSIVSTMIKLSLKNIVTIARDWLLDYEEGVVTRHKFGFLLK